MLTKDSTLSRNTNGARANAQLPDEVDSLPAPVDAPSGGREDDSPIGTQDVRSATANTSETPGKPGHQIPKPDAPLRLLGRAAIGLTHALVLCGIVGLLVWQIIAFTSRSQDGFATIVAAPLHEVRSPIDGVFVADKHIPNGTHVSKGQSLGCFIMLIRDCPPARTLASSPRYT